MIWDCFTYAGERVPLEIRIQELSGLPVVHVLVESNKTFTGNNKECVTFCDNERLKNVYVLDMPETNDPWERERWQRNAIMRGLEFAKDDDVVIISDVDEVPRADVVKRYFSEMGITSLKMDVFWYKLNLLAEKQTWVHPKILTYAELKKSTPNNIRGGGYQSVINNAGWHLSYLGDADYIVNKLENFSHQEYNTTPYKDKEEITRKIENGLSLWGESKFEKVEIDDTFPAYLRNNKEKFKNLIA